MRDLRGSHWVFATAFRRLRARPRALALSNAPHHAIMTLVSEFRAVVRVCRLAGPHAYRRPDRPSLVPGRNACWAKAYPSGILSRVQASRATYRGSIGYILVFKLEVRATTAIR